MRLKLDKHDVCLQHPRMSSQDIHSREDQAPTATHTSNKKLAGNNPDLHKNMSIVMVELL